VRAYVRDNAAMLGLSTSLGTILIKVKVPHGHVKQEESHVVVIRQLVESASGLVSYNIVKM